MSEFPIPRYAMLDVWLSLGGNGVTFEQWIDAPRRTPADAWSQLLGAVRGDVVGALAETNPPIGDELLALIERRAVVE